ncbi:MAG: D-alanyl-D-alanine carboxypeptidase/D-alanyl-D-alanine-endopeptidase [Gemmatimonadales bacterium]
MYRHSIALVCLWLGLTTELHGQNPDSLLNEPPFNSAHWGVLMVSPDGEAVYQLNPDHLFVPASTAKLIVAAVASSLLPRNFSATTSVYTTGPVRDGVIEGDLVIYGRGDPTFGARCYGRDTTAAGACETMWSRMNALADSIVAQGIRRIAGSLIGDGSFFEATLVHPAWESYDLNWWYAAPVSALGFNDNTINVTWGPGASLDAPASVRFEPDIGAFSFENRTFTTDTAGQTNVDFFRIPGTTTIWAEGTVTSDRSPRTEYFAYPDPNRYFVLALRHALSQRGIAVSGPTRSTTDSLSYRDARRGPPLAELPSRPLEDLIFPVLNSSQNWFAELLLKNVARAVTEVGSWRAGIELEESFLTDSVGADSVSFSLTDASGLSTANLISPRTLVRLLAFIRSHPANDGFMRALPRSGGVGSLRGRFVGTELEAQVVAKTGSINHVNSLAGYVERPDGIYTFAILVNNRLGGSSAAVGRIDSLLVTLFR